MSSHTSGRACTSCNNTRQPAIPCHPLRLPFAADAKHHVTFASPLLFFSCCSHTLQSSDRLLSDFSSHLVIPGQSSCEPLLIASKRFFNLYASAFAFHLSSHPFTCSLSSDAQCIPLFVVLLLVSSTSSRSAPDFDDVSSCASSASCSTHHVLIDVFINLQGCASSTEGARALYTYLFHCFLRDTYHSWLTLCSSSQKGESRTDTRKPTLLALLVRQTSHGLPLRPIE